MSRVDGSVRNTGEDYCAFSSSGLVSCSLVQVDEPILGGRMGAA